MKSIFIIFSGIAAPHALAQAQATSPSAMDILNMAANLCSLILSVIAIWLSLYFYSKTKDTETSVKSALAEIKQQTDSLQKLTSRQLDRLTKIAAEPRPSPLDEHFPQILTILQQIPQTITTTFTRVDNGQSNEPLLAELLSGYIGLHYYSAQTNFFAQYYLPPVDQFDETEEFHVLVKRVVDMSCTDFFYMKDILLRCDADRMRSNPLYHLYETTNSFWAGKVKSSSDIFVASAKQTQNS